MKQVLPKKRHGGHSIFYTYLFSYLLIGIVPLIISLWSYFNFERIVRREITISQSHMLTQLQYSYDYYIKTIVDRNRSLAASKRIEELMVLKDYDVDEKMELRALRDELDIAKKGMEFCSEVAVYLHNSDYLITNTKQYPPNISYIYSKHYDLTIEEFQEFINIDRFSGYKILTVSEKENYLVFIQNINSYNQKERLATIYTVVPWNNLSALMTSLNDGLFYWIDSDNNLLAGNQQQHLTDQIRFDSLGGEGQLAYIDVDGTMYINSYLNSNQLDIRYGILVPKSFYFARVSDMQIIIMIQILITVLIACALAFWYSRRNYLPIKRIITVLQDNNLYGSELTFEWIEHGLNELLRDKQPYSQAREALLTQQTVAFLKGWNLDGAALSAALSEGAFSVDKEYIILSISYQNIDNSALFDGITSGEETKAFELLRYAFYNIFEETVLSFFPGIVLDIDGMHMGLLNLSGRNIEEVSVKIRNAVKLCREALNLTLYIGSSDVYSGVDSFRQAYSEAVQVVSYNVFWGNDVSDSLLFYSDAYQQSHSTYDSALRLFERERELYTLLFTRNLKQAEVLFSEIIGEIATKDMMHWEIYRSRILSLADLLVRFRRDVLDLGATNPKEALNHVHAITQAKSMQDAQQQLQEVFDGIIQALAERQTDSSPVWLEKVVAYIDQNYTRQDLNVSVLAHQLDMNLSYIGRTFKTYKGYGITDYIHMTRIQKSKILLREGHNVRSVAEAVGYIDSKSLIRVFKKYEGITPGQYQAAQGSD